MSFRVKILIAFAIVLLVLDSTTSIYNSIGIRSSVNCTQELINALKTTGDQNRSIVKDVIDKALVGHRLTKQQILSIRRQFDKKYQHNTRTRAQIFQVTCNDGQAVISISPSRSPSK